MRSKGTLALEFKRQAVKELPNHGTGAPQLRHRYNIYRQYVLSPQRDIQPGKLNNRPTEVQAPKDRMEVQDS